VTILVVLISIVQLNGSPVPKAEASPEAKADHGYASGYGYGIPVRRPRYKKRGPTHTHHHYYHSAKPSYHAPKPSYHKPSYEPPVYDYGPPVRRPLRYAPSYDYDYDFTEPRPKNPIHTSHEDPWLHIHKEEAARSALLFGVGVLKGVAVTALINNANNGVTIGK